MGRNPESRKYPYWVRLLTGALYCIMQWEDEAERWDRVRAAFARLGVRYEDPEARAEREWAESMDYLRSAARALRKASRGQVSG